MCPLHQASGWTELVCCCSGLGPAYPESHEVANHKLCLFPRTTGGSRCRSAATVKSLGRRHCPGERDSIFGEASLDIAKRENLIHAEHSASVLLPASGSPKRLGKDQRRSDGSLIIPLALEEPRAEHPPFAANASPVAEWLLGNLLGNATSGGESCAWETREHPQAVQRQERGAEGPRRKAGIVMHGAARKCLGKEPLGHLVRTQLDAATRAERRRERDPRGGMMRRTREEAV